MLSRLQRLYYKQSAIEFNTTTSVKCTSIKLFWIYFEFIHPYLPQFATTFLLRTDVLEGIQKPRYASSGCEERMAIPSALLVEVTVPEYNRKVREGKKDP